MENSFLIIGLIFLLFLSMYGYSYRSASLEKNRVKKLKEEQMLIQAKRKEERIARQKARNEKLEKLKRRSEEIRLELNRLEKVNLQSATEDQKLVEVMKQRIEKKQKAS